MQREDGLHAPETGDGSVVAGSPSSGDTGPDEEALRSEGRGSGLQLVAYGDDRPAVSPIDTLDTGAPDAAGDQWDLVEREYLDNREGFRATYNKINVRDAYPLVGVMVVTYPTPDNGRLPMLAKAFESLRATAVNGFRDFEVFVFDDGSPMQAEVFDLTKAFGEMMSREHNISVNFKPIDTNTGSQSFGFNLGITITNASIIMYLDDDVEFDPDHIPKLAEPLSMPGYDLAYCRWRVEAYDGAAIPLYYQHRNTREIGVTEWAPGMLNSRGPVANFMDGCNIAHSRGAAVVQVLWPTGRIWTVGQYVFNDWELLSRWERHGMRVKFVNEVLTTMWFHGNNATHNSVSKAIQATQTPTIGVLAKGIEAWRHVRQSCSGLVFKVAKSA